MAQLSPAKGRCSVLERHRLDYRPVPPAAGGSACQAMQVQKGRPQDRCLPPSRPQSPSAPKKQLLVHSQHRPSQATILCLALALAQETLCDVRHVSKLFHQCGTRVVARSLEKHEGAKALRFKEEDLGIRKPERRREGRYKGRHTHRVSPLAPGGCASWARASWARRRRCIAGPSSCTCCRSAASCRNEVCGGGRLCTPFGLFSKCKARQGYR